MSGPLIENKELAENLFRLLAANDPDAQMVETHISTVLLVGDYAYKIKKPLDLGFLDFSTLDRRAHCCREEVRLNKRLAPEIYLDVVAIRGSPEHPTLEGEGKVIEYAVRMRRFSGQLLLSENPAALESELAEKIAERLAEFHGTIACAADDQPFGEPEAVLFPMQQNFEQVRALVNDTEVLDKLERLESWTLSSYQGLRPLLVQRKRAGFIRECHGDLHLGNIAWGNGQLIIFDGIEFNPALRWIDTVSELAFLLMDLDDSNRPDLAQRILNSYLQRCGDYAGLALLRFYQVYRAMVRCKVSAIRLLQADSTAQRTALKAAVSSYLDLALGYTRPATPALLITHGLSGSGKSTVSAEIMTRMPAIRLRSDVERKRLAGLQAYADSGSSQDGGIYSAGFTGRTYARLLELAQVVVHAGFIAIVDATFLDPDSRRPFADLADRLQLPFLILDLQAPESELRERVGRRKAGAQGASEADLGVLENQLAAFRPLTESEQKRALVISPSSPLSLYELESRLY